MIQNPRYLSGEMLTPLSLSVSQNITPVSTASMTFPSGTNIEPRTYVTICTPNGTEVYRTRQPQVGTAGMNSTVQLDHAIVELADSIVNNDLEQDKTISQAISTIWGYYKGSKWQLGSVAHGDTTVVLSPSYDNVLDAINDVLEQDASLMLSFDFTTTPWTVSIIERASTVSAEGRLGRNVKSASITQDDSDLCTRVYMQYLPGTSGNSYGHMDADTISTYGVVEQEIGGANNATQATRMATSFLEKHKRPVYSVQIDAVDLSEITGESIDSFSIGRKYRLALPDYGLTVEETITVINFSNLLADPTVATIMLSEEPESVINYIKKSGRAAKSAGKRVEKSNKEFRTLFDQTENTIQLWAAHTAVNQDILQQAGMYLDPNGVLVYATDHENNVGAKLNVLSNQITSEVSASASAIYSVIEQTASNISSAVVDTRNDLYSYVNQTASSIQAVVEDVNNDLHSEILQTQSMIRSAVWTANSTVFAYVDQTASYILDHVGERTGAKVFTGMDEPVDSPDNPITPGDLWLDGNYINFWDDADFQYVSYDPDDPEYDWTQLRGTQLKVWKDGEWQLAEDGTTLAEDTELRRTKDQINLVAYNLGKYEGELRSNIARLDVRADRITATVNERIADIGSSITQTAKQIRSEVHTASSQLYSAIEQTATYIRSYVNDEINDLGSEILQTASQIRAEVHASQSNLYSYVDQTATYIRSEVASVESGIRSSITQTASQIRSEVNDKIGQVNSSITQTASQIRIEVSNATSSIYSSIKTNADNIELKVNKNGVISSINQTSESITINAGKINLDGYVKASDITASYIATKLADASIVNVQRLNANTVTVLPSGAEASVDVATAFKDLSLTLSNNTYTLTLTRINGNTESKTFSRATSLSGNWSGDTLTITASPQNPTPYSVGFSGSPTVKLGITTNGSATKHESLAAIVVPMKVCSIVGDNWTSRYTENITVTATNLSAGNIKKNVVIFGVTGTYEGTSRTDKGSGWYCTIEQSGSNKNCRLSKTFSASQNVPFSNGSSYHLYT